MEPFGIYFHRFPSGNKVLSNFTNGLILGAKVKNYKVYFRNDKF